jgi:endonuclease YncB( thermonuclease family)
MARDRYLDPESSTVNGRARFLHSIANRAKAFLALLLESFKFIRLVIKLHRDPFLRVSALVFAYANAEYVRSKPLSSAVCVNLIMLKEGLAWPSSYRQLRSELLYRACVAAMRAAVAEEKGLWRHAMLVMCDPDPKLHELRIHIMAC